MKKILIIEDNRGLAKVLSRRLKQSNFEVIYSADGEDGYNKYCNERPDLIILDITLPKLNGLAICRQIRRDKKDKKTLIFMLTGKKEDVDRIVGKVIGADRYFIKPFDGKVLLEEIKKCLNS